MVNVVQGRRGGPTVLLHRFRVLFHVLMGRPLTGVFDQRIRGFWIFGRVVQRVAVRFALCLRPFDKDLFQR